MSWKPDLDWSISVLSAVLRPAGSDPENSALRDELNVRMATEFALGHMLGARYRVAADASLPARPTVTTLCGSSRFPDVHAAVTMHLTLLGRVVVPMGCYGHADVPEGARFLTSDGDENTPEKRALDELHLRKIEMSDGIFVVNPGDYVGSSTMREVEYARKLGKTVEWLFAGRRS